MYSGRTKGGGLVHENFAAKSRIRTQDRGPLHFVSPIELRAVLQKLEYY